MIHERKKNKTKKERGRKYNKLYKLTMLSALWTTLET